MERNPGIALIGCGLIGKKRQTALGPGHIRIYCDIDIKKAQTLADLAPGAAVTDNAEKAIHHPNVEAVMVATTNSNLAAISLMAIEAGKHVLVEKPAAIRVTEIDKMATAARSNGICVRVAYNHRYHPAFLKAREIFNSGSLGPLMFLRGRYGHGGRIGYDKEWRADPKLSGGGELIDQGVHLIDLAGMFMGEFTDIQGHAATYFWKMPVDDNGFISLRNKEGNTAWLHVSCTEWKNLFSLEIYGRTGKLHIEGLGGSYGIEKLTHYRMLPEMGPPETTIYEYPRGDESWKLEMLEFFEDIRMKRTPSPGLKEARKALEVVEILSSKSGFPKT